MSVQIALLKSGEEVIADIKEFRDSDDNLVSYFFGEPHCIKIKTQEILIEAEDAPPKHELIFYRWMGLSKDKDIIVNKDWVVCIADPLDSIVFSIYFLGVSANAPLITAPKMARVAKISIC